MKKISSGRRHLHKVFSLIVALLLIGSVSYLGVRYYNSSHAATGGSIYVNPASSTLTPGSNVTVTVRENSDTTAISSVQFSLQYNASQLQYVSMAEGDFPTSLQTSTENAGIIRVARGTAQGSSLSGDHAVSTLTFKVLATSGSTAVSFESDKSFQASNGQNITQSVTGGTYTIAAATTTAPTPTITKNAALSLNPATSKLNVGDTLSVALRLSSPTQSVYSVESYVTYPASLVQYVGVTNTTPFPTDLTSKDLGGSVQIVRGTAPGGGGFKGTDTVVTLKFKVKGSTGTIALGIKNTSGAYDGNGQNLVATMMGGNYGINTATTPAAPVVEIPKGNSGSIPTIPAVPQQSTSQAVVRNPSATYKSTSGGSAAASGSVTKVQGSIEIQPVVSAEILTANPGDEVVKVAYYLDKKLYSTKTQAPFSYSFDSTKLRNGVHEMTIKTYYKSGTVDSNTDKLTVKNPVTLSYVMAHYSSNIMVTLLAAVIVVVAIWKLVMPRFRDTGPMGLTPEASYGNYNGYASLGSTDSTVLPSSHEAPEPTVITPTGYEPASIIAPEQVAAAQNTQAIGMQNPQTFPSAAPVSAEPSSATTFRPEAYGIGPEGQQPAQVITPTQPAQPVQTVQPVQPTAPAPASNPPQDPNNRA